MAAGKSAVAARTLLETVKPQTKCCSELVKDAARIILDVHDEVRDPKFELQMTWVCEATNGLHEKVPEDILDEAIRLAKDSLKEPSEEKSEEN